MNPRLLALLIQLLSLADAKSCQGVWFELSDNKLTQSSAKAYCEGRGGTLANVYDEATHVYLTKKANDKVGNGWIAKQEVVAFLGGEKIGGSFVWTSGTAFAKQTTSGSWTYHGYNNWNYGTIGGSGACMGLLGIRSRVSPYPYTWTWGDVACGATLHYICEYTGTQNLTVTPASVSPAVNSSVTFSGGFALFTRTLTMLAVTHDGVATPIDLAGLSFSYTIQRVTPQSNGLYRFLSTSVKENCSVEFSVPVVVGSLQMDLGGDQTTLLATFNTPYSINCSCTGYYAPRCSWFLNGAEVSNATNNDVYQVSSLPSHSTLHVNIRDACNGGDYECRAVNWFGANGIRKYPVHVLPTVSLSPRDAKVDPGSEVIATGSSCAYPAPSVTWSDCRNHTTCYSVAQRKGCCHVSTLNVTNVQLSDGGLYRLQIDSGKRSRTEFLRIYVSVLAVSFPKSLIVANDGLQTALCSSSGYLFPTITWIGPDSLPITESNAKAVYKSESRDDSLFQIDSTLYVRGRDAALSGSYVCDVTFGSAATYRRTLEVQVPANVTVLPAYVRANDSFADDFHVDCVSYGWPAPTVTWTRNNLNVAPPGASGVYQSATICSSQARSCQRRLNVRMANYRQLGFYKCVAHNIGDFYRVEATFQAQGRASISVDKLFGTAANASSVTRVNCTATGFPTPRADWFRNGTKVSPQVINAAHQVYSYASYRATTVLVLAGADSTLGGSYTCSASNAVTGDSGVHALQRVFVFQVVPTLNGRLQAPTEFNQSQTATCSFTADNLTEVHWRVNNRSIANATAPAQVTTKWRNSVLTSELSINAASVFGANASVTCWAENGAGRSESASAVINKDLLWLDAGYFLKRSSPVSFAVAESACRNIGGDLATAATVNQYLDAADTPNGFWFQDNDCANEHQRSSTCEGKRGFICRFPFVEILESSSCYPDAVELTWRVVAKIRGRVSFLISAENPTGSWRLEGTFNASQPETNHTSVIRGLQADLEYNVTLSLFPRFDLRRSTRATSTAATFSLLRSLVGRMARTGDSCHFQIRIPLRFVDALSGIQIYLGKNGTGQKTLRFDLGNATKTLVDHSEPVGDDDDDLTATFQPIVPGCKTVVMPVIGNCSKITGGKPSLQVIYTVAIVILVLIFAAMVICRKYFHSRPRRHHQGTLHTQQQAPRAETETLETQNPYEFAMASNENLELRKIPPGAYENCYVTSVDTENPYVNN